MSSIYSRARGRTFLTGIQALVLLPMLQRRMDRERKLNTGGLVSGYRGSPLGAYDQQLWKASEDLAAHDVVFQPGLNEDLAATALWGAQMHSAYGETRVDGVFGIWYGKGPGVDRTGDVFRSANMLGTSPLGGVLAVSGDDHAAQSSMYPHQTDGIFQAASMPVLQPSSVQEVMELGLAGIALSRYCGLWVGLKTTAEVIETAAVVEVGAAPVFVTPAGATPAHGLNWDPSIAWPGQRAELERRLIDERLPAARAWARANRLDREVVGAPARRFGIVTVGKAHQDLMQAVRDLGLDAAALRSAGVSIYKVAMSWPLETSGMLAFADGHEELIVIEEKRATVETQLKEALYHHPSARRPRVSGKTDPDGAPLLAEVSEFTPLLVARKLVARMGDALPDLRVRLQALETAQSPVGAAVIPVRAPYFCSGCPHNTSTRTPDGSVAGGGIGCHVMALAQPALKTATFSQMGGEGAQWIGAAPFSAVPHIFQNLGDGTYQHSGLLAVRAAVAAKARVTYKILYNDAVAMTGGQQAEGLIDPARITRQLHAEGVSRIVLVSDDAPHWEGNGELAPGTEVRDRSLLDAVQRELRGVDGVTAIVYVQTCAAEKRRKRKRKEMPDPDKRLFINERVCEGCGDCSVQSNCIAVEPLETAFGRKRKINQGACNKDFSCAKGFCPSFIEIDGPRIRKPDGGRLERLEQALAAALPQPAIPAFGNGFNVLVTGIGGSGVLTMGALLGGAAHLEGKGATVLDFTGLAQKNGAVISQVRMAPTPADIAAVRIGPGAADLLLAADLVVASASDALVKLSPARAAAVANLDETPTAEVISRRDATQPTSLMLERLRKRCVPGGLHSLNAGALAQKIFGDTVTAHTLMLGFAWQRGLVPLSFESIDRAIEMNGAAVAQNRRAFAWGRIAASNPAVLAEVDAATAPAAASPAAPPVRDMALARLIDHYAADLAGYQDAAYAQRYRALVEGARSAEAKAAPGRDAYARAVAIGAYRLMAYKDEYEVARLYGSAEFKASLAAQFSGMKRVSLWLAPPLLSRIDPATGRPKKRKFGAWILPVFGVLARCKGLRGTAFDPFGHTEERRHERRLAREYAEMVDRLNGTLSAASHARALELAALPQQIRGFGPVKLKAIAEYDERRAALAAGDAAPLKRQA
ncbi:indolepyruvate ferredoxin oxidoreductase family protein [Pseudoduganella namucuonensis]|uniref:Indolepyruvate ferredoxin oxidoreductase n=1 Tax=Pseudoduganella namucuonensis TaxID=1035707 RepID=A0A1I7GQL0_9BURK|nr:indolepyruvate ferredoxin oxidoreductase family protein [Pseudoduganella namucuonensis]SFU50740.1 indolepyruvate ferredoxin oxidoreductase [Pseudoduganella namucuonensis]